MQTVTPTQAQHLLRDGATLVDVREAEEWRAGHAPDAVHIPLGELDSRRGELDRSQVVLSVCRSGRRSAVAQTALVDAGFDARNVEGGMQAWQNAGLPVVGDAGVVARVI